MGKKGTTSARTSSAHENVIAQRKKSNGGKKRKATGRRGRPRATAARDRFRHSPSEGGSKRTKRRQNAGPYLIAPFEPEGTEASSRVYMRSLRPRPRRGTLRLRPRFRRGSQGWIAEKDITAVKLRKPSRPIEGARAVSSQSVVEPWPHGQLMFSNKLIFFNVRFRDQARYDVAGKRLAALALPKYIGCS